MYTLHKKHPFNIRWRCVARSYYCRGSLITTADCKKPRVHMEHNHEPDYIAVKAARRRYKDLGKPAIADCKYQHNNNFIFYKIRYLRKFQLNQILILPHI